MRKIKVGIIQQANASDIRINLMNLLKVLKHVPLMAAQLVVLQELHNSLYFCQTEIRIYLNWQNPFLALLRILSERRQPIG